MRVTPPQLLTITLLAAALAGTAAPAAAQFGRIGERVKRRVEQKVGEKVDKAVDKAVDGAEAKATGTPSEAGGEGAMGGASASLKAGEGAWANYDFVPGERAIFVDDFSADRVGNFPQRLEFKSGNMEIVDWQGARWLRAEGGEFFINLPETLPERFTMEFGLAGSGNAMQMRFNGSDRDGPTVEIGTWFARMRSGDIDAQGELGLQTNETPVRIRISVDGDYLKLYANEKRALNVPNAKPGRAKRIYVDLNGWSADSPRMISDVRIMAGGRRLYDALAADGRVATQGILFDIGSDRIRPESTPTLKEITDMLKAHADLKLTIEGHTDNVGNAASNQALSEKRAAAVVAHLVQQGIDASRLEAKGFGDTKPVASNDTSEGRQQNRRVELVRR